MIPVSDDLGVELLALARREFATQAQQALVAGRTKAQFRQDAGLSAPKAYEAWKDADVLSG